MIEMVGLHRLPGVRLEGPSPALALRPLSNAAAHAAPGLSSLQSMRRCSARCCVLWLIAEVFVVIKVAEAIGAALTVVLLIASWPIGRWALRSQGGAAWRRLTAAVDQGRPPANEVIDGALVLLGGILLIVPGFITDVFGILLLPPTRALMRPVLLRNAQSRLFTGGPWSGRGRGRSRDYDVDSTATDVDQPQLRS